MTSPPFLSVLFDDLVGDYINSHLHVVVKDCCMLFHETNPQGKQNQVPEISACISEFLYMQDSQHQFPRIRPWLVDDVLVQANVQFL